MFIRLTQADDGSLMILRKDLIAKVYSFSKDTTCIEMTNGSREYVKERVLNIYDTLKVSS